MDAAELLAAIVEKPTPRTMQWCARALRPRVAAQLQHALAAAVLATQAAPGTAWELEAHRWAWAMPMHLLRAPPADTGERGGGQSAAATQLVRRR